MDARPANPGSRGIRMHPKFNPAEAFAKIPRSIGVNDTNVVFGLGTATNAGAGTATLSQTVPRSLILRDMTLAAGSTRGRVTQFQASGVNLLLGGSCAVETFAPLAQNRPPIDLPVYSGTVLVQVTLDAAFTLDGSVAID